MNTTEKPTASQANVTAAAADKSSDPQPKVFTRSSRFAWLLGMCLVIVGLDQASKQYAVTHFLDQPPLIYFNDLFRIEYAENHGAFLSILSESSSGVRFVVLTVVNGIVLLGLSIALIAARNFAFAAFLPLSLFVAGGIGNLIDRVLYGYVIDFLNIGIGSLRSGIFNVADIAISLGFILIVPVLFKKEATEPAEASPRRLDEGEITKVSEQTTLIPDETKAL